MQVGDVQTKAERREAADARWKAHLMWRAVHFQHRPCPPAVIEQREVLPPNIQEAPSSLFLNAARKCRPFEADPAEELLKNERKDDECAVVKREGATSALSDAADSAKLLRRQAELLKWNPVLDPKAVGVPSCTAFVANLSPTVTDEALRNFGEVFGRVVKSRVVRTFEGDSRRYGFVVFSLPREMQRAVADGNGQRLNGRRLIVEAERGRQGLPSFRPKRLRGVAFPEDDGMSEKRVAPTQRSDATVIVGPSVKQEKNGDELDSETDLLDDLLSYN